MHLHSEWVASFFCLFVCGHISNITVESDNGQKMIGARCCEVAGLTTSDSEKRNSITYSALCLYGCDYVNQLALWCLGPCPA